MVRKFKYRVKIHHFTESTVCLPHKDWMALPPQDGWDLMNANNRRVNIRNVILSWCEESKNNKKI